MKSTVLFPVLLLWGCTAWRVNPDDEDSGEVQVPADDSLRGRLGCLPGSEAFISLELERSALVSTVTTVRWETSEPLVAWVVTDVGREALLESPVPDESATTGESLVLEIPVLRTAELVVVAETEAGRVCSEVQQLEAGTLPTGIPEITLSSWDPEQAAGGITLLSMLVEGPGYVVAVDALGEYIWYLQLSDFVEDSDPAMNRALLSRTDASLLFMIWAKGANELAQIYRVGLDGQLKEIVEIPGAQKDFVELPDGTLTAIGWDVREFENPEGETVTLLGDHLIEMSPEGETRIVWSAFDTWTPDLTLDYPSGGGGYPADPDALDWSHVNGIDYDEATDSYLVSVFGMGTLISIDRQSGEPRWTLANSSADYASSTGETLVQGAHSVELLDEDRVLVFNRNIDNPFQDESETYDTVCSEAVEIGLDPQTGEASRAWSYGSEDCLLVVFFGEARRLDNGNTMVIFSSSGQVSESTPSGETVWQVNLDVGGAFGFGERVETLY